MLGAIPIPGAYYERGLAHPMLDFEQPQAWLNTIADPVDAHGQAQIPQLSGLGLDIDFDYIAEHALPAE